MNNEKMMARFWSKVNKNGPAVSHVDGLGPCWLWKGSVRWNGYGKMKVGDRTPYAHRISWKIHNGPIPAGMCALHRCDTPACVNPAHLFLGTHADNARDMRGKGRDSRGSRHPNAKLKEADILEIRAQYADGRSRVAGIKGGELAKRFGVNPVTISEIVNGKRWRHV